MPINSRGFARRTETALRCAKDHAFPADPHAETRWLNTNGRALRNSIAHGNGLSAESDAAAAQERLQEIVRCVLRQYLRFAAAWLTNREEIANRLTITADSLLAAAYVTALEVQAKQPGTVLDLLQ